MKAKTRHFPITDFGGRGGLNFPFNWSKIVGVLYNLHQYTRSRHVTSHVIGVNKDRQGDKKYFSVKLVKTAAN